MPLAVFAPVWRWLGRWGFRSFAVYVALTNLVPLLLLFPKIGWWLGSKVWAALDAFTVWFGSHVLRLAEPLQRHPSGSGDTLFDWVHLAFVASAAVAVGLIWSFFDRDRKHDHSVYLGLRVVVRYTLAATMLSYGFSKVFHLQMPSPEPLRLITRYGDSSPMGLLWIFMGVSPAYSFFAGAMEVLGGALLLFRRTTHLGALITAMVMTNVVLMNFCFDVPVKIYSSQLLILAAFLAAHDFKRLLCVLLTNRPTTPIDFAPRWPNRWTKWTGLSLKVVTMGSLMCAAFGQYQRWKQQSIVPVKDLAGLYTVESFSSDGVVVPPLLTDRTRWRWVGFNRYGLVAIYGMTEERGRWLRVKSMTDGKLQIETQGANSRTAEFVYSKTKDDEVHLEGEFEGHRLAVDMRHYPDNKFLLLNRGFHWVSEYPFNR